MHFETSLYSTHVLSERLRGKHRGVRIQEVTGRDGEGESQLSGAAAPGTSGDGQTELLLCFCMSIPSLICMSQPWLRFNLCSGPAALLLLSLPK